MTYVPTHVSHPSPQTQELAHKLEHTIREYRQSHPGMSPLEISQAVQLAESRTGAGGKRNQMILAAMVGATVLLVLGSLLFWSMA